MGTLLTRHVELFLTENPEMSLRPVLSDRIQFAGTFYLHAEHAKYGWQDDTFELRIDVPNAFPQKLIRVWDIGGRIPLDYHRLDDESFCLGSELRQRLVYAESPTITAFVEKLLVPYLYGYSYFERHSEMPFGELKHGDPGLVEDFKNFFGVDSAEQVINLLELAGGKKRVANKQVCPCNSGNRLGTCHNLVVNSIRSALGRGWSRSQAIWIEDEYLYRKRLVDSGVDIRKIFVKAKARESEDLRYFKS